VVYVFVLYAFWDLLGLWMAKAKIKTANGARTPRYPVLKDRKPTNQEQTVNWIGMWITIAALILLSGIWFFVHSSGCAFRAQIPIRSLLRTFVVLLAYRLCKEIRTSYQ